MHKKKIVIIISLIIAIIALSYTSLWLLAKNRIETVITTKLENLRAQGNINTVSFDLTTSCFPFLCTTIKDMEIITEPNFQDSAKGYKISLLFDQPLTYTIYNIFNPKINHTSKQTELVFTSENLDTTQTVDFKLYIDKLELKLDDKSFLFGISGSSLQAKSLANPYIAIADIGGFNIGYMIQPSKEKETLSDISVGYSISNFNYFDNKGEEIVYKLPHSKGNLVIKNLDKMSFVRMPGDSKNKKYAEKVVSAIVENSTQLLIPDFKLTDSNYKINFKGYTTIGKDFFLNVGFNGNIKTENTPSKLKYYLDKYQIKKDENNNYKVNVITNSNVININNNIRIPALFLKPANTSK